ncbi:MAG: glycoside hydrolase family 16 protein [Fibrobacter sp.]|nr:glycoside hydrolase family 16 protein [Fibrobacter sp.]
MQLANVQRYFFALLLASANFFACSSDSPAGTDNNAPESSSVSDVLESSADVAQVSSDDATPASSAVENPLSSAAEPSSSSQNVIPSVVEESSSSNESISSSSVADVAQSSSADDPASSESAGLPTDTPADPTAFWSDEFNGTALDLTKWTYETGNSGWGNNELQYYTDRTENTYVMDGILHIAAKKEDFGTAKYTSARIITKGKIEFTYGTIEARIALPSGKGIWPAFWMLGKNIDQVSWPTCGEIDIIEAVNDESVVYGTHHWAHEGQHAEYGNNTKEYYGTSYPMDITQFHNYKMTWDKSAITMYVDDFKYQEIGIEDAAGEMGTFHKDFFFILNVAVGGTWPGFEIDDSQFPNEMLVDYIRVYKK